ncbi:MAG: choline dehydrogenase [Myxococcota bacterium]|nr:choline dehydrogenase [Myxococcota bacterium]
MKGKNLGLGTGHDKKGPPYDFLIVGGGSAGCALANRLSADKNLRVLVLEAGRPDSIWDLFIHMPAALAFPIGSPRYDWKYQSDAEPCMNGRQVSHARGKVLGGSSSINGMIFQRGNPADYDGWAQEPGLEQWSYAHCLPYFKRMENALDGDDAFRGREGPLHLERGPAKGLLFEAFFEAARQAGHPQTEDVNGAQQEGFGRFDRTIRNGRRWSAARAYYHPIKHRPNLQIQYHALASRILFEGERAIGVEYFQGSKERRAYAKEVICCGGAINSAQLLQLSGIGPPELLQSLQIPVRQPLAGVGQNLQDHLEVYIQHHCKKAVSMAPHARWARRPWVGLQWLMGRGPGMTNHFEAGGFIRSNPEVPYPNLMIHFLPLAIRYDGTLTTSGHGYQLHIGPMLSDARGELRIRSRDPKDAPSLRFNYLSTPQDRKEWVEAIACARNLLGQPAFNDLDGGEFSPGPEVATSKEVLDWVAREGETALHPSCSCRMGTGSLAVVDPQSFRVHGLRGLRVVDASIMPKITNANIYAPVMMMAEKAADAILGNQPLPAEQVHKA